MKATTFRFSLLAEAVFGVNFFAYCYKLFSLWKKRRTNSQFLQRGDQNTGKLLTNMGICGIIKMYAHAMGNPNERFDIRICLKKSKSLMASSSKK